MTTDLLSRRLRIRRFLPGDASGFAAYRSDPEVARYQSWNAPFPLERALGMVTEFGDGPDDATGWVQWAIERQDAPGIIGDIGVNRHDDGRQATIGYTLAAEHQGSGYATEAVGRMIEHLFSSPSMHRVSADCDARNMASANLLKRLGFRQEGHLVAATWAKGEWTDDLLFGLLRQDWAN